MKASLISELLHIVGSDLHKDSLRRPVKEIATSMRLIGGPSEMRRPLNVGLMFFNEQPEHFFPYARIEVVDKPDRTISDEDIQNRRMISRRYRNRRIGYFLKELKLVEGRKTKRTRYRCQGAVIAAAPLRRIQSPLQEL